MKNARFRAAIRRAAGLLVLSLLPTPMARAQQAAVTVTLNPSQANPTPISERFSGLSYEVAEFASSYQLNGQKIYRLSAENQFLVNLWPALGIRNVRLGGNTSDQASFSPTQRGSSTSSTIVYTDDLDRLFALANDTGVSIILTVPLKPPNANAPNDALEAGYAWSNYQNLLYCFAIGNEPDLYPSFGSYAVYKAAFDMFKSVINLTAPGAPYCGPCVASNNTWAVDFANDRGGSPITHHNYPGGNGQTVTDPAAARYELLAINNQGFYSSWVPQVLRDGLPYRLEETNSFYNGGAANVSDTFASALWGLDYMQWWASRGADGLNFHGGGTGEYTPIAESGSSYSVRPLGYGIKAFDLGGHGHSVPVTLTNPSNLNLTAYGVLAPDNRLFVTIVNKTTATNSLDAAVTIAVTGRYGTGSVMYLSAPNNDLAALTGVTLGGSSIGGDGSWDGVATPLPPPSSGRFSLVVPGASAAVVTLFPSPLPPPRPVPSLKRKAARGRP